MTTPTIDERVTSSASRLNMIDLVGDSSTRVVISCRQDLRKEFGHLSHRQLALTNVFREHEIEPYYSSLSFIACPRVDHIGAFRGWCL
jgi:hypothetical protein